jgi:hypothetical protein
VTGRRDSVTVTVTRCHNQTCPPSLPPHSSHGRSSARVAAGHAGPGQRLKHCLRHAGFSSSYFAEAFSESSFPHTILECLLHAPCFSYSSQQPSTLFQPLPRPLVSQTSKSGARSSLTARCRAAARNICVIVSLVRATASSQTSPSSIAATSLALTPRSSFGAKRFWAAPACQLAGKFMAELLMIQS